MYSGQLLFMTLNIPLCFAEVQILGKHDRCANLWNLTGQILVNITADPGSDDWKKTKDSNLGKNKKIQ